MATHVGFRTRRRSIRRFQGGAAALVVTLLLAFAMLFVAAALGRGTLVEIRHAANAYRSSQAFEAAEAGLEWTIARLNDPTPIGDDCLPDPTAGARSFRDRQLRAEGGVLAPFRWDDGGTPVPLQAACVVGDGAWSCSCPANGPPTLPSVAGTAGAQAFVVELAAGARPGLLTAASVGCTRVDTVCPSVGTEAHESVARVEVGLGLVPGLAAEPAAALTAKGRVDTGAASLGVFLPGAGSGGMAIHAGGTIVGTGLRLDAPPGSALVAGDTELAGLPGERYASRWLGMDRATWSLQPAAVRIACSVDCSGVLTHVVDRGARLVAASGDVALEGPLSLGTAERPIVLVAGGALRLRGAVAIHGVVVAGSIDWNDASADAALHGALIADGDYGGDAAVDIVRDAAVLRLLRTGTGSYARINGSWKDF